jgi:hypothetical protein
VKASLKVIANMIARRVVSLPLLASVCFTSTSTMGQDFQKVELQDGYPVFQQAQDLRYGHVLFEYHQGNFFEALTALNVAKQGAEIAGHGDHPLLVEGGLMLAYGMVEEAKKVFESLLREQISPSDKNQAWYYLGKVFFLIGDDQQALDSFKNVSFARFIKEQKTLMYDLSYMKAQIYGRNNSLDKAEQRGLISQQMSLMSPSSIWHQYLQYNAAISLLEQGQAENSGHLTDLGIKALQQLAESLAKQSTKGHQDLIHEWRAGKSRAEPYNDDILNFLLERVTLRDQSLLTLGQLYLQAGVNQAAFNVLKEVRKGSALSDQALFAYSVAATNLEQHGLALEALNQLKNRPLFTPWLQQVPYALAYLYEQMSEPQLALHAYRAAVTHYEMLADKLKAKQADLDEGTVISAMNLPLPIGDLSLENDAYGMLPVEAKDFNFAYLMSSEAFQRQLSELHELYQLQNSLQVWTDQLDSFDTMMATRIALRDEKIAHTKTALEQQDADSWAAQQASIEAQVTIADAENDIYFFMDQSQIDYAKTIERAYANLALLPEDHRRRATFEKRLSRVQRYFEWSLSESYSLNRWAAVKEVRGLKHAVSSFKKHQRKLEKELSSGEEQRLFEQRISQGRERLSVLRDELSRSLAVTREKLLELVLHEFSEQADETALYLLAAREAQARLSDTLLRVDDNAKEVAQ